MIKKQWQLLGKRVLSTYAIGVVVEALKNVDRYAEQCSSRIYRRSGNVRAIDPFPKKGSLPPVTGT